MAPSTDTSGMEFEVFLSFRGSDTRDNFVSCLYHDMVEKGIRVFKDDKELQVGDKTEKLLKALDDSQIYIPVFSQDFASSAWCLREVARMVDHTLRSKGKKEILPIFFDVEPNDVKLRTELYKRALSKHEEEEEKEEKYGLDEVKRWRDALREVPTRVGWKREGKEHGELVKLIVREVLLKLKVKNRSLPDNLVEMDDEAHIEKLLKVDSADHVRFVIIHGTGGIGKTTLASIIFNRFHSEFDYSSFLENVQDLSQHHGLLHVQKKLLSDTLGSNSADGIHDTNDGINRIRKGLSNKKVLIVVDNVNEKKQLENLAGSYTWFASGSRIIVTVRDRRTILDRTILGEDKQTRPSYYIEYPVKEMPLDRAVQLFSKHAFRSNTLPKDWHNFSEEVISSIGRLPLTLEVVGSLFANTNRSKWDETLEDLKQVPCEEVRETLMISFNKLDPRKKEIFLDIACFCIGEDKTNAYYMWDDCGYSPRSAIDDLLLMSLIKIDEDNEFWMHDEIRDLGRYIVKEGNFEDVGKRRWVEIDENTLDMLKSNEEKRAVRALSLRISHDLTPEEIACLPKLRFLGIASKFFGRETLNFVGDFKNTLRSLRWLSWHNCPLDFSATNLHLVNLVVLDLSWSNITHDWGGWRQIEMVKKLKVLNLTGCEELTTTPDFSEFGKLEKLILARCLELSTIDSSIGKLKLLITLNIRECNSLQGLPDEIGSLECLSEIIMPFGDKPFKLSETLGNLKSLTQFEIRYHYGISLLPRSIGRLTNLTNLSLHGCFNLQELPDSIGELESLVELDLQLSGISILPDSIGNLKRLKVIRLGRSKIQTIPCSFGRLEMLEVLDASFCWYLKGEIPWELWSLTRLRILDLYGTPISRMPTNISGISSLQELKFESHQRHPLLELPSSLKCLVVKAAKFPVLPNLSSLVHLQHLQVCGTSRPTIAVEDIYSKDEALTRTYKLTTSPFHNRCGITPTQFSIIPNLCDPAWESSKNQVSDILVFIRLEKKGLSAIEYLNGLRELKISSWGFLESTPNLSGLKRLQDLDLSDLPKLAEIPGLGELESLEFLRITRCHAIELLPNLSKLKNLQLLKLYDCRKMRAVEGLKELNSLKYVEIQKCMSLERLPDLPAFTKLRINKMLQGEGVHIGDFVPRKRSRYSIS